MATITVKPVAGANSPCDGVVAMVGQDTTLSSLRAAAGNQGGLESVTSDKIVSIEASTTTDQFSGISRAIYNFDTSALGSGAVITAATFSVIGNFKTNGLGDFELDLVSANPASSASLPDTDYPNVGSTSFASVPYSSLTTNNSTYTNWTLNSSGLSHINKTGITSLALRCNWDLDNSFTGTWASGAGTRWQGLYADEGSNKEPKLEITYTDGGANYTKFFFST